MKLNFTQSLSFLEFAVVDLSVFVVIYFVFVGYFSDYFAGIADGYDVARNILCDDGTCAYNAVFTDGNAG